IKHYENNVNHSILGETLFNQIIRILQDKRPYGFILEKMEQFVETNSQSEIAKIIERFDDVIAVFEKLDYKLSWRLVDSNDGKKTSKRIFILGTLGSATILSDVQKENRNMIKDLLFKQEEMMGNRLTINLDSPTKVTEVQKELLR